MTTVAWETERSRSLLMTEIERYLATVDVFRAEGCMPLWDDEQAETAATLEED
jgi:hypothetical protein